MTIDEVVLLLQASQVNGLSALQEMVLRSIWEGKTYTQFFAARDDIEIWHKVTSHLWCLLSNFFKEPINEFNFRSSLENRALNQADQELIKEFHQIATVNSLEYPSVPVSLESRFYIPRPPVEELIHAEIAKPASVIRIKASRKMGTSSLMLRVIAQTAFGYRTVNLHLQAANKGIFASFDEFWRWLCVSVSQDLQLEPKLDDYWNENQSDKAGWRYFYEYLLPNLASPLVVVLNDLYLLFEYPQIAEEFLALVHSWHEQGKRKEIGYKLCLILIYSTTILAPSISNVGLSIDLPPFTTEQVQYLAQLHGLDWTDGKDAEKLIAMVGGHPYLVRLALFHLVGKGGLEGDLQALLQKATTASGIYHDYLKQYLIELRNEPELASAFYEVITVNQGVKLEQLLASKLEGMGLARVKGDLYFPACELYRLYFLTQIAQISQHISV